MPNLISGRRQDVVSGGVQRKSGDRSVVNPHQLQGLRGRNVPDADGRVVRGRDDHVLRRVVDDAVDLLGVAFENGNDLKKKNKTMMLKKQIRVDQKNF